MKKTRINNQTNPDPYEDIVKLEKLDPYESLIKSYDFSKQKNKSN